MDENVYSSGDSSIRGPCFLPELRALLYTGSIERGAFYRSVAERNFCADGAADVYLGGYHLAGVSEAKPVPAGH
jgi:hypothetical protein